MTTKSFVWKDRDTAARDMLQLVYHAPPSISRQALQLLEAFRSSVIFPELEQIVLDEGYDEWERRYALRAIAAMPGDLYLPQFARLASTNGKLYFDDLICFVSRHTSNLQWFFQNIEKLAPKDYLRTLQGATDYYCTGNGLNTILCQRIVAMLEDNPLLLDLDVVATLYYRDGSDITLKWLNERWDTLIYLCLAADSKDSFMLLEGWNDLREAVFKNCPTIIDEYNERKAEVETLRERHHKQIDYQASPIWQELNELYQGALEGNSQAYGSLCRIVQRERNNLSKRAVATNLLGKLKHKYDVRAPLFHAIKYAPDDMNYPHSDFNASCIRIEAGEALRDILLPDVWETMVDAFFIRPRNVLEEFMSDWIEYLTDKLSGLEKEYTGYELGDENNRFWFRALIEKES